MIIKTLKISLVLGLSLGGCAGASGPSPAPIHDRDLYTGTVWLLHRQPRPGTVVRVFDATKDTSNTSVVSSFIADNITTTNAPALSEHIVVDRTGGIAATVKFITSFLPSADAHFKTSSHIERDAKSVTSVLGPERTSFLQTIFALDGGSKNAEGSSLFASIKSQPLTAVNPKAGALYIVTSVSLSPDVTWIAKSSRDIGASVKETAKVATGSLDGSLTFNGSNEANYKGTPMVVSVVLRRIGRDGDVIRYDDNSFGPKVATGE